MTNTYNYYQFTFIALYKKLNYNLRRLNNRFD